MPSPPSHFSADVYLSQPYLMVFGFLGKGRKGEEREVEGRGGEERRRRHKF
jgi:hypothetical protein